MIYEWGTPIFINNKYKGIFISINPNFKDEYIDGKYLVILENTDEIVETNYSIEYRVVNPHEELQWGDWIKAWDDEIDKNNPYIGIFLKKYDYQPPLYSIAIKGFIKLPSEGFCNIEKI